MKAPQALDNEAARIKQLHAYNILDTLPEEAYDDIVRLAAHICGTPIALISLVDHDRQWFKAKVGLDAEQTGRDVSFCGHVVESGKPLYVYDAHQDERFADNPLVTGDPKVCFYAGAPLSTEDDLVLGTLCVIDHKPREITTKQKELLRSLANTVMRQFRGDLQYARNEKLQQNLASTAATSEKLQHLQERFFTISSNLMCIVGNDTYFQEVNPAWTTHLGYKREELLGKPLIEFIHPQDKAPLMKKWRAMVDKQRPSAKFNKRFRASNGDWRWLSWTATLNPAEENVIASVHDLTPRVEHEKTLTQARLEAETANRSKSEFLATMSHELRTPLNSIIGFSKLLGKNKAGNLSTTDLKYISRVSENGLHLLQLINEILDISKIEAGKMTYHKEMLQPEEVVEEVIRLQEVLAQEKGISIELVCPEEVAPIHTDRKRLKQILLNLLSNAVKFTEQGGVTLRVKTTQDHQLRTLELIDTGIGMDEGALKTIFQPFTQVDSQKSRSYMGTGLGLAIVESLCQDLGIQLEVESEPDKGSTFRMHFLQAQETSLPEENTAKSTHYDPDKNHSLLPVLQLHNYFQHSPKKILLIDDDADTRSLLSLILQEFHCEIREASNGEEGLLLLQEWEPDLLIIDLLMPKLNGWQLVSSLKASDHTKDIPIALVSVVADDMQSSLPEVEFSISKPVTRDALQSMLQAIFLPNEALNASSQNA